MLQTALPARFLVQPDTEPTGWQPLQPTPAQFDVDARELLLEFPEILTPQVTGPVFRLTFPCDSDFVLAALDETGQIALVGVKTPLPSAESPSNANLSSQIGSRVVADLLWTGAMLWRRPYDSFAREFREKTGAALEVRMAQKVGENWSLERFRSQLTANLNQGRFPVFLVSTLPNSTDPDAAYLQSLNIQVSCCLLNACLLGNTKVLLPTITTTRPAYITSPEIHSEPSLIESPPPPSRVSPSQAEQQKPEPSPSPAKSVSEPEETAPRDFPWARAGTKPGVMAGKRPPPPESQRRHPGRK